MKSRHIRRLEELISEMDGSEAMLETFFRLSPDLLLITERGRLLKASRSFEVHLGWSPEELLHRNYMEFVACGSMEDTRRAEERLWEKGLPLRRFKNYWRRKDGTSACVSWNTSAPDELGVVCAVGRVIQELSNG